jgi:Na+-translocating ferredoxin:NAD+ oxidoreductase RnfE subunit
VLIKTRLKSSTELSSYKMLTVCPLLVVTTTISRSLAMAIAFSVTLLLAQLIVALFKKIIPLKLRTLLYVSITAFCASIVEILVWYLFPKAADSLGIYLPILAVSCIILVRLESTKAENSAGSAILDSLLTSAQMILVMLGAATIRELLGLGKLFSNVFGEGGITVFKNAPVPILQTTAGVLFLAGIGAAVAKLIVKNKKRAAREKLAADEIV